MMDGRLVRHPLGFLRAKELPDPETLRAYYASRYFQTSQSNYRPSYSKEEIAWFHMKTARIAAIVASLRGSAPGTFLDVGCGEGFAMDWFGRNGWTVRGLDFSRAGMEKMNPHLLDQLETGDIQELLDLHIDKGHSYDLLWLTNILEHVVDPLLLLTRVRQSATSKGVLVVTVPNDGSDWQEFLYASGRISERFWIAIPDHLSYFDSDSLRAAGSATGWSCARITGEFPIDWFIGNAESNYVSQKQKGYSAHQAQIAIDTVLAEQPIEAVNAFYTSMAAVGMGRQLTGVFTARELP
jgi:2-polyprenyl-3-methyl-5-hydroxy-6-metoxy-1,4-benzoquinol methylase